MMPNPFKKLIYIIYFLIITLIFFEIGIRIWGYSEHYIYDPIYMPFETTEDIPYIHKPDLKNVLARGLTIINTDSLGLRSKISGAQYNSKKDDEYRIAIVGDSVTFGQGVKKTKDTFVQILGDILNQKQNAYNIQVFNYGVSAYSVKEMAASLQYRILEVQPNLVIMAIIPNDFDISRAASVDRWGYTSNKKLSGFMPKDSIIKRMLRKVRLVYLLRDLNYRWRNKSKYVRDVNSKEQVPESYSYLKKFKNIAKEHNLLYKILLLPSLGTKFGELSEQLDRDEISFLDLSSLQQEFTQKEFKASQFDAHPSAMVHRMIGEILAEHILHEQLE